MSKKILSSKQTCALGIAVASALSAAPVFAQTVFFNQSANGQAYSNTFPNTPNAGNHTDAGNYANNNNWSQQQIITTDGYGDQYQSQPSNWTTPTYPNSSTVAVNLGANTVTLDVGVVVNNLFTAGSFNILGGESLEVTGSGIDNLGTITVNSNQADAGTVLTFDNGTLSGAGTVVLNGAASLAQINGILTQTAGNTIQGQGEINAALTNSGMVNANVSGGTLYLTSNSTNSATFEATSGGTLLLDGISVAQGANGLITAATGSNVSLINATITGGTLTSSGTGLLTATGSNTLVSLTNNAAIQIPGGQAIYVTGNLVDNGSILINSDQADGGTVLSFSGGTLSGTGTITLNYSTNLAQLNGTLTQASGHLIQGQGEISAALTNSGTVDANVNGQILYLYGATMTNSATFEATNSGTLSVYSTNVTQTSGGKITASGTGNLLSFVSSVVTGGSVSATGGAGMSLSNATFSSGTVTQGIGGTLDAINGTNSIQGLTNSGAFNIQGGSAVYIVGPLVDNGTITVNSDQVAAGTALSFDGGTLSGNGTLTLNYNSNLAQLNGTLTQAAGHTIQGQGEIGAALTNSGTVNANVNGQILYVYSTNATNSATFEATSGGDLSIYASSVTQGASGLITAATGSNVSLVSSTITGGTLGSSGTGLITATGTNTLASLTNNAAIQIPGGQAIYVTGNLVDNGSILINSDQAAAGTVLYFSGGILSGTGTITLNDSTNLAQLNGTLTQASGHLIQGQGEISAALTNSGTVDANVNGQILYLYSADMTNSATFEATNSGTLSVYSTNVTQTSGGKITASGTGNLLSFVSSVVTGGSVSATGGAGMSLSNATFSSGTVTLGTGGTLDAINGTNSIQGLTNSGAFNIQGGSAVYIVGPLVDNGTITVNSDQVAAGTALSFDGGTLSGNGTLTLNYNSNLAQLNGTLTQAAGHTIAGQGEITAALTNSGTVNANVNAGTLYLLSINATNSATFEATSGGDLSIYASNLTQGASGQIIAANGSNVNLVSSSITGGTLSSSGTGVITATGTDTLVSLTNNAAIQVPGGNAIYVTGNLVDNASILVNSDQAAAGTFVNFNGGTLSGTGTINLNNSTNLAQLSGSLTQAAGHTIAGQGEITAALTNSGTVNANAGGQTLYFLSTNTTNTGTLEATNSGILSIYNTTVTQSTNGQIAASTGGNVQVDNSSTVTGGTLNSSGTGVITIENNSTVSTSASVTDTGKIVLGPTGALTINGLLTITGSGAVDVSNGLLTINYGAASDPNKQIHGYLATGYAGDKWTGVGIDSSIAATNPNLLAVGYADGSTDNGTPAVADQIIIKTTLAGDANLDGIVNFPDLLVVAQDYGKTGEDWAHGDFNYDGIVNFPDLLLVAQNYGKQLSAGQLAQLPGSFASQWQLAEAEISAASVPEPGTIGLLAVGAMLLARRRRSIN